MNRFAALLDRLAYEPGRNAKLRLMTDYFRTTPDPERGFALAALAGGLTFANAKPGLIRALIAERTDPVLFGLSYDYVGDLSETVALLWPAQAGRRTATPGLAEVVEALQASHRADLPGLLARWLDALDETGRWALLKLITGGLRIGVSARLAKSAVAGLGDLEPDEIEEVWHGLEPPYEALFAWAEGRAERPEASDPAPFRPPMLAHAIEDGDFDTLDPAAMIGGVEMGRHPRAGRRRAQARRAAVARLYSRTGEDISRSFPDIVEAIDFDGAIDGELLVLREGRVQSFNVLQQRLNRESVTPKMLVEYPAHIRAYDLLTLAARICGRCPSPSGAAPGGLRRRAPATALRPLAPDPVRDWDELAAARADPAAAGAGEDAGAVEGCMIKRADSPYVPGRPKGLWYKWKRDPHIVDAVLMYAQRGHGKRSSFYSDFTFGVWRGGRRRRRAGAGRQGLFRLHRRGAAWSSTASSAATRSTASARCARSRTNPTQGLVLEVAFEGLEPLDPAQVRRRHALSPHLPHPLGQAARARPTGSRRSSG